MAADRSRLPQPASRGVARGDGVVPATPLWQRVPTRDEEGNLLSDFMLLVPGLRQLPRVEQGRVLARFDRVLRGYDHAVVFVECNLRLNLLWVSVRAIPGICAELAGSLLEAVPQARLVGQRLPG